MKIKTDFVTNSSSTAYIVYVPKGYPITDKKIMDQYEEQKKWTSSEEYKQFTKEDVIKYFNQSLHALRKGEYLGLDEYDTPSIIFAVVREVLEKEGLIVRQVESGPSGSDVMLAISKGQMDTLVNIHNLYGGEE